MNELLNNGPGELLSIKSSMSVQVDDEGKRFPSRCNIASCLMEGSVLTYSH